ncbi:hypothetical protein BC830DRAFT_1168089 [Chytriomyces sp. MP71]|nr:hypothetical protein BC830DRAFT_1168089 [Chytriomyces sp. MP71]
MDGEEGVGGRRWRRGDLLGALQHQNQWDSDAARRVGADGVGTSVDIGGNTNGGAGEGYGGEDGASARSLSSRSAACSALGAHASALLLGGRALERLCWREATSNTNSSNSTAEINNPTDNNTILENAAIVALRALAVTEALRQNHPHHHPPHSSLGIPLPPVWSASVHSLTLDSSANILLHSTMSNIAPRALQRLGTAIALDLEARHHATPPTPFVKRTIACGKWRIAVLSRNPGPVNKPPSPAISLLRSAMSAAQSDMSSPAAASILADASLWAAYLALAVDSPLKSPTVSPTSSLFSVPSHAVDELCTLALKGVALEAANSRDLKIEAQAMEWITLKTAYTMLYAGMSKGISNEPVSSMPNSLGSQDESFSSIRPLDSYSRIEEVISNDAGLAKREGGAINSLAALDDACILLNASRNVCIFKANVAVKAGLAIKGTVGSASSALFSSSSSQ